MQNDLNNQLFGPLGKEYCVWFYFLSVWFFIGLIFLLVSGIALGIQRKSGLEYYLVLVISSISYLAFYFQNRLLHSMCIGGK